VAKSKRGEGARSGARGGKQEPTGEPPHAGEAAGRPAERAPTTDTRRAFWAALGPGDPVETPEGDLIGEIAFVRDDAIRVRDPVEERELLIPRDACEARPGGGARVRPASVHARGGGPERFVRRSNLADEWVPEQTSPSRAVTVEGEEGPLVGRRVTEEGDELVEDERDIGAAPEGEQPSEVR
jgi:hypothetical protein